MYKKKIKLGVLGMLFFSTFLFSPFLHILPFSRSPVISLSQVFFSEHSAYKVSALLYWLQKHVLPLCV